MAYRPDLSPIRPSERPGIFNREAGGWSIFFGFIGAVIAVAAAPSIVAALGITGSAVAGAIAITEFTGLAAGFLGGLIFGGKRGMLRQQRELENGRVVKDPTYLNGGIWNGLATVMGVNTAITGGMLLTGMTTGAELAVMLAAPLTLGAAVLPLAAMTIGSLIRKNSMQRDFDQAMVQRGRMAALAQQREMSESMGRGPTIFKDSVSAQEAALLESKQAASRSHADGVTASRAQPAETQRS